MEEESDFVKRMLSVYDDKELQNKDEMLLKFETNQVEANRNAATLVLICINKLYDVLIKNSESCFEIKSSSPRKISTKMIKRLYITCSKLYLSDFLLYISMKSPKNDIFYTQHNSKDWEILGRHFIYHEFPNPKKIINAYQNFFALVAIGNTMINKSANR